jgi:hypothetical protein
MFYSNDPTEDKLGVVHGIVGRCKDTHYLYNTIRNQRMMNINNENVNKSNYETGMDNDVGFDIHG